MRKKINRYTESDLIFVYHMLVLRSKGWSYPKIALQFNKDHTTVMYHCKKFKVSIGGPVPSIPEFERQAGVYIPPSRYKYQHLLEEQINPGRIHYADYLPPKKKLVPWD